MVHSKIHKLPHMYAVASECRSQAGDSVFHEPALPLHMEGTSPIAIGHSHGSHSQWGSRLGESLK